ncbi:MAG: helix-turn-helix domain-containing protein [Deltaproteobacteria bacterium]|nr:helix-turn-helix domain-containing protein [Deltaproteobacteria bacterium]
MRARKDKWNYLIQSVSHALEVLEELVNHKGPLGVTELSKQLKLHKNNIFRLLATLEVRGYVAQDDLNERYYLGPKTLSLAQAYEQYSSAFLKSEAPVKAVRNRIDENVYFVILVKDYAYYINGRESSQSVRAAYKKGHSVPLLQSAGGRLLAALTMTSQEINALGDASLKNSVEDVKSNYVYVTNNIEKEIISVAVPVKETNNRIIGAIQVDAPVYRISASELINMASRGLMDYYDQSGLKDTLPVALEVEKMVSVAKEIRL